MEGCNTVDEGECLVVCNAAFRSGVDNTERNGQTGVPGDGFRLQDSTGVNKIVALDDRLVWTATGSSSIKRWKAPPRRSLRANAMMASPETTTFGHGYPINSRRTSGSSDIHSPRRGFGLYFDNSPRFSDDPPALGPSPTTPRSGKNFSTSTNISLASDTLVQDEATLFGIPYQSLVRLVSPNDFYSIGSPISGGGYGGGLRGYRDAEVATLYSAASVKSVSIPVARHSLPPFTGGPPGSALRSPFRNTGGTLGSRFVTVAPDHPDGNWTLSPRAAYEARGLAATASPLETYSEDVIQGEHGLVRSTVLNDKMHVLTVNTAGCVAVWDITRYVPG